MRALDGVGAVAATQVGRRHQQQCQVHRAGNEHRDADIPAGCPQQHRPPGTRRRVAMPFPGQSGMHIHRVRHHCRSEHCSGQQHALHPIESGNQTTNHRRGRWRVNHQGGQETDGDDQQQSDDDPLEDPRAIAVADEQQ